MKLKYGLLGYKKIWVLVIMVIMIHANSHRKSPTPSDYFQLRLPSWAVNNLSDLKNIYDKDDSIKIHKAVKNNDESPRHNKSVSRWKTGLQLNATPLHYSFFHLISTNDFEKDYNLFSIISLITYFFSILTLCYLLNFPISQTTLILGFSTILFGPYISSVFIGNVNQIQLSVIVLFLVLAKCRGNILSLLLPGLLMGLLVMFKPNLIGLLTVFFPLWLINNSRDQLIIKISGLLIGIGLSVATPYYFFGKTCSWFNWPEGYLQLAENWTMNRNLLAEIGIPYNFKINLLFSIVLSAIPFILISRYLIKRKLRLDQNLNFFVGSIGLTLVIFLLSAPIIHEHYFLLTIPLILFVLRPRQNKTDCKSALTIKTIGIISVTLMSIPQSSESAFTALPFIATLILYWLTIIDEFILNNSKFFSTR